MGLLVTRSSLLIRYLWRFCLFCWPQNIFTPTALAHSLRSIDRRRRIKIEFDGGDSSAAQREVPQIKLTPEEYKKWPMKNKRMSAVRTKPLHFSCCHRKMHRSRRLHVNKCKCKSVWLINLSRVRLCWDINLVVERKLVAWSVGCLLGSSLVSTYYYFFCWFISFNRKIRKMF